MTAPFEVGAPVIAADVEDADERGTIVAVHDGDNGDTPWCEVRFDCDGPDAEPVEFGIGEVVSPTGQPWDKLPVDFASLDAALDFERRRQGL